MSRAVRVEINGMKQLEKTLLAVGQSLDDRDPKIKAAIFEGPAAKAVATAKGLAPVKTGTLRKAIYATKGGKKQRGVLIGVRRRMTVKDAATKTKERVSMFYARFVEYGTSRMGAQPFFRPAILQMGQNYANDMAAPVKKIVEETAKANAYHPSR